MLRLPPGNSPVGRFIQESMVRYIQGLAAAALIGAAGLVSGASVSSAATIGWTTWTSSTQGNAFTSPGSAAGSAHGGRQLLG